MKNEKLTTAADAAADAASADASSGKGGARLLLSLHLFPSRFLDPPRAALVSRGEYPTAGSPLGLGNDFEHGYGFGVVVVAVAAAVAAAVAVAAALAAALAASLALAAVLGREDRSRRPQKIFAARSSGSPIK